MLLRFEFTDDDRAKVRACLPPDLADRIIRDLEELVAELRHVSQVRAESDRLSLREAGAVLVERQRAVRAALAAFRNAFRPHPLADAMLDAQLESRSEPRSAELVGSLVKVDQAIEALLKKDKPKGKGKAGPPVNEDVRLFVLGLAQILRAYGVRAAVYDPAAPESQGKAGTPKSRSGGVFARLLRVLAPVVLERAAPTDLKRWIKFLPKERNTPVAAAAAARQRKADEAADLVKWVRVLTRMGALTPGK